MGLHPGGPTFGGIFIFEIWWAYYPVGLLSCGLTYGILRYCNMLIRDKTKIFGRPCIGSFQKEGSLDIISAPLLNWRGNAKLCDYVFCKILAFTCERVNDVSAIYWVSFIIIYGDIRGGGHLVGMRHDA